MRVERISAGSLAELAMRRDGLVSTACYQQLGVAWHMTLYRPNRAWRNRHPTGVTETHKRMQELSECLQTPISTAELERRWAAVRAAMERDKVDVLLMQNNSDQMGGYVKYFTDLPATNGYPLTVVFPRDDLMTLVSQGPFGGVTELNGKSDGTRRGVKRWYTTPSYSSCYYTAPYDPELAAKALEPYTGGTIGLVS